MACYRTPRHPALVAISLSSMLWSNAHAHAQTDDAANATASAIPDVVVTAQRTSTLASKTPVALSVLSGEQLQDAGITAPSGLAARLPNVHLDGAADGLRITIRGVSSADATDKGDPSAAFMLDGIYIARPQAQNLSFYDLDRVEVLRGPQGTLYGRNTTAGAVNVISKQPVPYFEAAASVELGTYSSRNSTAMLNLPVNAALALRLALAANRHDSYLHNGQGTPYHLGLDRDDLSLRLAARLALGNTATLLLRYDHSHVSDNNDSIVPDTNFYQNVAGGKPSWYGASTRQRLTNGFVAPNAAPEQGEGDKRSAGLGAELNWNLGWATLSYLGAHRRLDNDYLVNYYYRIAPAYALGVRQNYTGAQSQDSHELRLASNASGPVTAQGGLYYFREESRQVYSFRDLEPTGLPPYYVFPSGPTVSRSKAVFGQATYHLSQRLRASAGARYTADAKTRVGSTNFQQTSIFNPATDFRRLNAAASSGHQTTWRLGLEYDLAPRTLLYGSLSTGYKSGGFNDGCLTGSRQLGISCPAQAAVPASALFYQPEQLKAWEAGVKSRFWDDKASLNASAFTYDYTNLQLSGVAVVQGAPRFVTSNAGQASVKGLELDGALAPTAAHRFSYGLTLLDAHYVRYVPDGVHSWAGDKLDRAPSHTFTLGYEYRFRLAAANVRAGLSTRKSAAYMIGVPTQQLHYRIPARTTTDATISYLPDAAWSLHAYVKNLENQVQPISIDSFGMVVPSDPRTAALRLDYRF